MIIGKLCFIGASKFENKILIQKCNLKKFIPNMLM